MKILKLRHREVALAIVVALSLGACGGGGNVRPAPPPAAPPPPAPPPSGGTSDQPPLDAQLALTDTYAAHDQGFTGQGITIGVVDSGIMRDHPALKGRVSQELIYVDPATNDTAVDDVLGHGTWVSEILAGTSFDQFPGGIAPGSTLVSARIISDTEPTDDGSGQGNAVTAADATFFGQYLNPDLIAAGVQIQNNSWGGIYWDTADPTINQAFGDAYSEFVLQHDGLVVFAAGNDGRTDPSDIAALPNLVPALEKGWLVAAAVDSNSVVNGDPQLASYSNACGVARDYCLVAPGDVIVSGKDDTATSTTYWIVTGTSFAAPQVSGAAALVWEAYPYFDNDLVRQTLLGTAQDLGVAGPDSTFGYGLLDVGKAVNGPAQFNWGDVTVNFSGESSWNNAITGAGGLVKQGTGTLNLTQDAFYTGLTHVEGGILNAMALASSVQIDAGGTLGAATSIAGSVDNAGVLTVSGGDLNLAGDYNQHGSGRLAIELGSVLQVAGTATLAGGDLYVIGKQSGYTVHAHTEIINTVGGLTGTFSAINAASNVMLTATPGYDATSAWLDVTRADVTAIQGLSYTAASAGAAKRVEGAFQQLDHMGPIASLPVAGSFIAGAASLQRAGTLANAQQSLESLSGQLHAASTAMTFEAIDAGTRALSDRFDQLAAEGPAGGWMQDLSYHGGLTRGGYTDVGVDMNGWLAGQDLRLGETGVAGLAVSQTQGLGRLAESADQGRSHALEGMLYGGLVGRHAYVMGRAGFGNYRESTHRRLQLGDVLAGVSSDSQGSYDVAYGETGYRTTLGPLQLTPYASLQYARIHSGAFAEPGAYGFGLKARGHDVQRWQAGVGLRAGRQWTFDGGNRLGLQAHLDWQQAFAARGDVFDASFTGIEQWAPLGGIGLSRYGGVAGLAVDLATSPRGSLQFGLDHHFAQREHADMATLSYRLAW